MNKRPYVSVVIVGRNDGYGDDFIGRMNTFVRSLDHRVESHPGVFELIIVEWNPPGDYAPLADVINDTQNLPVRFITVPADLHNGLGAKYPMLEFHGKNVGIRRALGEFVLVTNPDIIFTQELIDEIAQRRLRLDTVYRTDRYDFTVEGIHDVASSDLVDFAVRNTFVVHAMADDVSVSEPVHENERNLALLPRSGIGPGVWHTNGCGDFLLAAKEAFFTVRGLYQTLDHRWHLDSISLLRFMAAQIKQHVFLCPWCIFHQHHDRNPQDVQFQQLDVIAISRQPGVTDWGLRNETLVEITKGPM